jgi:hypothetical protein
MSPTAVPASGPLISTDDDSEARQAADGEARWRAWQTRGRARDLLVRRRLLIVAPTVIVAVTLVYLILIH